MGWSLLPNALRTFKIYCALPPIISQLVLFLWQTVEIGTLGHVRVVEALQNFVQNCDSVTLSGIHIHIAGVQQFHCYWNTFCIKDLYQLLSENKLYSLNSTYNSWALGLQYFKCLHVKKWKAFGIYRFKRNVWTYTGMGTWIAHLVKAPG